MILRELFSRSLSEWAEQLIAASFVLDIPLNPEGIEGADAQECVGVFRDLCELPKEWARELCLEVLQSGHGESVR